MDALNDDVTLTERAPKFMHVPVYIYIGVTLANINYLIILSCIYWLKKLCSLIYIS